MDSKENKSPRQRARKADGSFKGDDPKTPGNDAWKPVELSPKKENKYKVKPKVNGSADGGKYSKKPAIRPTFGSVTTTSY